MTQRRGWQISAESPLNERGASSFSSGMGKREAAARSEFTTLSLPVYDGQATETVAAERSREAGNLLNKEEGTTRRACAPNLIREALVN